MNTLSRILISLMTAVCLGGAAFAVTFAMMQEEKFYIYNLGIDVDHGLAMNFLAFGDGFNHPGAKLLPTFEYQFMDPNSQINVYAPCDGVIYMIEYQDDTKDYEIHINPHKNRSYRVLLDHVNDLQIKDGDKVKAGDVIGKLGNVPYGSDDDPLGLENVLKYVRTELMIKDLRQNVFVAPFAVFDPATKSQYEAKVTQLMIDMEAAVDWNVFDWERMADYYPGCYFETMPGEDRPQRISPIETIAGIGAGVGVGLLGGLVAWFVTRKKKTA